MKVPDADGVVWGPAMLGLTDKQRRYVLAQLADPFGSASSWARAAGYSNHMDRCKVTAHFLEQDPRIARAVQEVARQYLTSRGPILGLAVMMKIARNDAHRDQLKAATALADRVGFHAKTEHHVTVDDVRGDPGRLVERVRELAAQLGVDASVLLGAKGGDGAKVIEHRPTEEQE